jgi:hypothetical protein
MLTTNPNCESGSGQVKQKLVKLVDNIRCYNYDVEKVTNEFSDLERLRLERKLINVYNHLEAMKFGIKELWFLPLWKLRVKMIYLRTRQ